MSTWHGDPGRKKFSFAWTTISRVWRSLHRKHANCHEGLGLRASSFHVLWLLGKEVQCDFPCRFYKSPRGGGSWTSILGQFLKDLSGLVKLILTCLFLSYKLSVSYLPSRWSLWTWYFGFESPSSAKMQLRGCWQHSRQGQAHSAGFPSCGDASLSPGPSTSVLGLAVFTKKHPYHPLLCFLRPCIHLGHCWI